MYTLGHLNIPVMLEYFFDCVHARLLLFLRNNCLMESDDHSNLFKKNDKEIKC